MEEDNELPKSLRQKERRKKQQRNIGSLQIQNAQKAPEEVKTENYGTIFMDAQSAQKSVRGVIIFVTY